MKEEDEQYSFDVSNNPDVVVGLRVPMGYYKFHLLFGATAAAAGTSFGIIVRETSKSVR